MYTSIINIQGTEEELWARLNHDKRYEIRKALKNDISAMIGDTKALKIFYHLLEDTLGKAGLKSLPEGFFRKVLEKLKPLGMANLWIAVHQETIISSAFILYFKNTAYYWNIGWRREYANVSPNDLITWEIVREANQKGYKYYDLLRLEPDRLPGIARWKNKFGGDVAVCYYLYKSTIINKIWRGVKMILADPPKAFRKISSLIAGRNAPR
jgi:lipid II:glycine glycyltransferase (peptidoglycan interpeptide bridge formation enzyme)